MIALPSKAHERIVGRLKDRLQRNGYILRRESPIRGFYPDVMGERFRGTQCTSLAVVEVEAMPDELWSDHTDNQLRKLDDFASARRAFSVLAVLAVPPELRTEARALVRSRGRDRLEVWSVST